MPPTPGMLRRVAKSGRAPKNPDFAKRKRGPNIVLLDDVTADEVKDWAEPHILADAAPHRIISLPLNELGPGPHVVFLLRALHRPSIKKIAQKLGLSVSAVRSRLRRVKAL
jgi:DNA-directed RNA polymerase specialized sigma24 family protein